MADPWDRLAEDCAAILARPQDQWSRDEEERVWSLVTSPPVARTLYKYARRSLRSPQAAEEVVAETLGNLAARAKTARFNPANGSFRSWVFSALYKRLSTHLSRVVYRRQLIEIPWDQLRQEHSVAALVQHDLRIDLTAALEKLDPQSREVVQRSVLGRDQADEIAKALGLTESHVRVIKFRAIRQLRGQLGGN